MADQPEARRAKKSRLSGCQAAITPQSSSPSTPMSDEVRRKRGGELFADADFQPGKGRKRAATSGTSANTRKPTTTPRGTATVKSATAPYHVSNQDGKAEPYGEPSVWAEKRQQLCETLPYYLAYQSSTYVKDGIVLAILIDKEIDIRDKFLDEVIITNM